MKESYRKGKVSHPGPEPWGSRRKACAQASVGVHVGTVWSLEKTLVRGGRPRFGRWEGNTRAAVIDEAAWAPAGPKTCARMETPHTGIGSSRYCPGWHRDRMDNPKGTIS